MTGRRLRKPVSVLAALAIAASASAQMHKVDKPQTVVRAVGVYEWTGNLAKPTASRLIPVSLYINQQFQDAGVYLASPVPFALLTGNVYELDQAGIARGTVDLLYARHVEPYEDVTSGYDDGWFGYGKFVPPAPPKLLASLPPARTTGIIGGDIDADDSTPHFSSRSAVPGSGGAAKPLPGATSASGNPAPDADRPTLHRSSDTSDTSDQTASNSGSGNPPDDPDRPTLRRRSPEESKEAKKQSQDQAYVSGIGNSLNDDPNRPILRPGRPPGALTLADFPQLVGLPPDLHQMVAVSDATDRPPHDFARPWADDTERQKVLADMETAARAQLAAYVAVDSTHAATTTASTPSPTRSLSTAHKPGSKSHRPAAANPPAPAPIALLEEQLKGFTLSYGGDPTFVYSAHTAGAGASLMYVTLVAQEDMQGQPLIALKNVTDAGHLDRTPRMQFIDAVDADASNRASLLFELRGHTERQFALYRVIGPRADQLLVTGATE